MSAQTGAQVTDDAWRRQQAQRRLQPQDLNLRHSGYELSVRIEAQLQRAGDFKRATTLNVLCLLMAQYDEGVIIPAEIAFMD